MRHLKLAEACILALALITFSDGLEIGGNEEGSCATVLPADNVNFDWIQSVSRWYIPAGSRYQLLRCAAGNPLFFPIARDFEFYYGFCPQAVMNFNRNTITATGFSGSIGTYKFSQVSNDGVIDFVPQEPIPGAGQHITGTITLTDNKSFMFVYKCWKQIDQRGWEVYSTDPEISPRLQNLIEQHAVSLGLDRSQFEFLRYDFCNDERYQARCTIDNYNYSPYSNNNNSPGNSYNSHHGNQDNYNNNNDGYDQQDYYNNDGYQNDYYDNSPPPTPPYHGDYNEYDGGRPGGMQSGHGGAGSQHYVDNQNAEYFVNGNNAEYYGYGY